MVCVSGLEMALVTGLWFLWVLSSRLSNYASGTIVKATFYTTDKTSPGKEVDLSNQHLFEPSVIIGKYIHGEIKIVLDVT